MRKSMAGLLTASLCLSAGAGAAGGEDIQAGEGSKEETVYLCTDASNAS